MSFFELNCLTTAHHLMTQANRQHHLDIYLARDRQDERAERRERRERRRTNALDALLMAAIITGAVVTTLVLNNLLGG